MLCFFCDKKLIVGKSMKIGEYGMLEVDIKTHCIPCRKLFEKKNSIFSQIENTNIEMKGHLREYRDLKKQRDKLNELMLDVEYAIFSKENSNGMV